MTYTLEMQDTMPTPSDIEHAISMLELYKEEISNGRTISRSSLSYIIEVLRCVEPGAK